MENMENVVETIQVVVEEGDVEREREKERGGSS